MVKGKTGYIGVDIGGTNLRGAVVLPDLTILCRLRDKTGIEQGIEPFLQRLCSLVNGLCETAAEQGVAIQGAGLGIPGLIGADGTIRSSVNLKPLEGVRLGELVARRLGFAVRSGNDANLIALGESRAGAGQGLASLAVITIGTGLGSGLILDGRLWTGSGGFAAELGHVTVEPEGYPCLCGNRGCLEQYVSASALARHGGGRQSEELARLARTGDPAATAAFEQLGYWLGIGISGLVTTLNLDGIVIGGGVSGSFDLFEAPLRTAVRQRLFAPMDQGLVIRKALLGDDAGLLGAALLHDFAGE